MPLLRSLDGKREAARFYKHGAPSGAEPRPPMIAPENTFSSSAKSQNGKDDSTENSEEPPCGFLAVFGGMPLGKAPVGAPCLWKCPPLENIPERRAE
jgi:hypothetical protein